VEVETTLKYATQILLVFNQCLSIHCTIRYTVAETQRNAGGMVSDAVSIQGASKFFAKNGTTSRGGLHPHPRRFPTAAFQKIARGQFFAKPQESSKNQQLCRRAAPKVH
jgi:hypothetical protein